MKNEYIDHFIEAMAWMKHADFVLKTFGDVPAYYYSLIRCHEQISLAQEAR